MHTKRIHRVGSADLVRLSIRTSTGWVRIYRYRDVHGGTELAGSLRGLRAQLRTWDSARTVRLTGRREMLQHLNLLNR